MLAGEVRQHFETAGKCQQNIGPKLPQRPREVRVVLGIEMHRGEQQASRAGMAPEWRRIVVGILDAVDPQHRDPGAGQINPGLGGQVIDHCLLHSQRLQRAHQPERDTGRAPGGGMGDGKPALGLKCVVAILQGLLDQDGLLIERSVEIEAGITGQRLCPGLVARQQLRRQIPSLGKGRCLGPGEKATKAPVIKRVPSDQPIGQRAVFYEGTHPFILSERFLPQRRLPSTDPPTESVRRYNHPILCRTPKMKRTKKN
jgi:hypothetical protein